MLGRKFQNARTGEIVKVDEVFENIAILDNGDRVSVQRLGDRSHFDEVIDPSEFLSRGAVDIISQKIKSLPDEVVSKMPGDDQQNEMLVSTGVGMTPDSGESAVVFVDPEEEKRRLLEKYGNGALSTKMERTTPRMKLEDFLDEEEVVSSAPMPVRPIEPVHPTKTPQELMFGGVKRSHPIELKISINTHLPRPDFIEMMEDSYEYSIIDWLSQNIADGFLSDKNKIIEEIKQQIRDSLGKRVQEEPKISTPTKTVRKRKVSQ
jgi:hypothetical protein